MKLLLDLRPGSRHSTVIWILLVAESTKAYTLGGIQYHKRCLRAVNMLLTYSSCSSSDNWLYWSWQHHFPLDNWWWTRDNWFLQGRRWGVIWKTWGETQNTIKKKKKNPNSKHISVENQDRCQTFTPKLNGRLFFFRSLPSTNIVPIPVFDKDPSSGATSPSFQLRPHSLIL